MASDWVTQDEDDLKMVHYKLAESGYFNKKDRFFLRPKSHFGHFRGIIEKLLDRTLYAESRVIERNQAKLHSINVSGIVERANRCIEELNDLGLLTEDEAGNLWERIEHGGNWGVGKQLSLKEKLRDIKRQAGKQLSGGRPREDFKAIRAQNFEGVFRKHTELKIGDIWSEITGLFLIFRMSKVECGQDQEKKIVYSPESDGGVWRIIAKRKKKQNVADCSFFDQHDGEFYCDELARGNKSGTCGCTKAVKALRKKSKRWEKRKKKIE